MPPKNPATIVLAVAAPILDTTPTERPTLLSESVTKPLTGVSIIALPSLLRQDRDTSRTSARYFIQPADRFGDDKATGQIGLDIIWKNCRGLDSEQEWFWMCR